MKKLPLYPLPPLAPVNTTASLSPDPHCTRCTHSSSGCYTVCMPAELSKIGDAERTLLIVGDHPGEKEDVSKRPMMGMSGQWLRELVRKHWDGKVAIDNAIRCRPKEDIETEHIEACRSYLARTIELTRPERIIATGTHAVLSLLGRKMSILSARKGYGWVFDKTSLDEEHERWIPVFITSNVATALRNRFVARDVAADIVDALTNPLPEFKLTDFFYYDIETEQDAIQAYKHCVESGKLALDTETSGMMHHPGFLVDCLTLWPAKSDVGYKFDNALNSPAVCSILRQLLTDANIQKIGHNIKYDMTACLSDKRIGVMTSPIFSDTMLVRKLLEADVDADLETAAELVGMGGHKKEASDLIDTICADLTKLTNEPDRKPLKSGKARMPPTLKLLDRNRVKSAHLELLRSSAASSNKAVAYHYLDPIVRGRYNALDACSTMELHEVQFPLLKKREGTMVVHDEISISATKALAWIEHWGVLCDRDAVNVFDAHVEGKLIEERRKLDAIAQINWDSPKQVAELFFDKMKMQPPEEGSRSTDKEALALLADKYPVAAVLSRFRKLNKLQGTYARGIIPHIRADGRVHCTYRIAGTESGRISSADPNMQNITSADKDPEFGKMNRDCFYAPNGYVFFEGDMSQQEIRVAAAVSGDPVLIAELSDPSVDIHRKTASLVYGLVTDEQRSKAKSVTFGLMYGKTDFGLAKQLLIDEKEARRIREVVLSRFKVFAQWIEKQLRFCKEYGGVWCWWNGHEHARWRPLYNIAATGPNAKSLQFSAGNASANTPIQGPAADFVTASLWPLVSWVLETKAPVKVVLTVHDSIICECREDFVPTLAKKMDTIMRGHNSNGVPLMPDFKMGPRWGSLKKYKLGS